MGEGEIEERDLRDGKVGEGEIGEGLIRKGEIRDERGRVKGAKKFKTRMENRFRLKKAEHALLCGRPNIGLVLLLPLLIFLSAGGFGMRVVGGKQGLDKKLGTFVTSVIKGGPADAAGIIEGNRRRAAAAALLIHAALSVCCAD